ncbi:LysR substrate-binding domain-containing protein [Inquilinus sp. OTU3971]|uniref:LysR substrate-binding domain-containing protein n=1 Tax=Inquilinus sp. OTU3971 TaxID=3043855 RepID=UPI00313ED8D3
MNRGIELRHLTYFACLAEELHFGRAADRLGMAQAPLSQQIRQLEERMGVRLFDRTTRRVKLTAAGEILLRHARDVLSGLDRAISHTRAISGEHVGHLVVGGVHLALSQFLPAIIRAFRQDYPAVSVDVVPLTTAEQLKTLDTGGINVAFIRPTTAAGFMQMERLSSEGFVAVLPRTHPLAAKPDLSLRDFSGQPFIGYAPILGASYSNLVLEAFRQAGVRPMVVQDASHTLSIVTLAAAGVGLGIVPSWVAHMPLPELAYRPLDDLPQAVELAIAWPAGETSPAVLDFVRISRLVAAQRRAN